MTASVAALPMYDWPELRAQTDAEWVRLRDILRAQGVDAPERLARINSDLPAVSGGIRDASGQVIAPDPASLPPAPLHLPTLWRHPNLFFAQACWGPMELGLSEHVQVIGQSSYDDFEGGQGAYYSSAILMRCGMGDPIPAPADGRPVIPMDIIRGKRLGYNSLDSMSGMIALARDLAAMGERLDVIFPDQIETSGHRASMIAVAEGRADVCAVDCRSFAMARQVEAAAERLQAVGWTARRHGLPFITSARMPAHIVTTLRSALAQPAMSLSSSL
ncbi:phosphate/phosphite/phosphonate ABC transporter substrate-binding protein [Pseudaminobacter sp. NGMCC 1.201702]|uniref:phosphate/phosphite/phosphonate ABC transporter substrate-binding protein n=1 Tax=Pseudaminobacter sp. NGMCC 1.201702 TaxID=3391825 RepID=UPI0039EFE2C4